MTQAISFCEAVASLSVAIADSPMKTYQALREPRPLIWQALVDVPRLSAADWHRASMATRWLVASRAALLPLTGFAALFGIVIAGSPIDAPVAGLTLLGLLLAHATNNLINDHVDARMGLDADNYFRTRYGTQPLAAGWISARQHLWLLIWTGVAAAVCGVAVLVLTDFAVLMPLLIGALFALFYTWPMKHIGLGEVAVWIVWGPLMVGATVLAVSGSVALEHWLLGSLYGLGPLVVILGKHTDKRDDDRARGVRTLPALLPEAVARGLFRASAIVLIAGGMAWALFSGQWAYLLLLLALPSLVALLRQSVDPRPSVAPDGAVGWPLWFAASGFLFARSAGALLLIAALAQRWLASS